MTELIENGESYFTQGELHGLSVSLREVTAFSTLTRPTLASIDLLAGKYNYLDLRPLGRQEDWEEPARHSNSPFLAWVGHQYRYGDADDTHSCCVMEGTTHKCRSAAGSSLSVYQKQLRRIKKSTFRSEFTARDRRTRVL
jgi:hypothetical protein